MTTGMEMFVKMLGLDPEQVKQMVAGIPQIMANVDRRLTEIAAEQQAQRAMLESVLAHLGANGNGRIDFLREPPDGSDGGTENARDDAMGNAENASRAVDANS